MSSKLNSIDNQVKKGGRGTSGGGGSSAVLENLAQESYGISSNIDNNSWWKNDLTFHC